MKRFLQFTLPLLAALLVAWLTFYLIYQDFTSQHNGQIIYALDDPYIHMSMARNLVQHGVFGITPSAYTASSSSPLWTFLLAALFAILGVQTDIPLWANLGTVSIGIVLIYLLIRQFKISPLFSFVLLLGVIYLSPMIPLIFSGMEHNLHIVLAILVLYMGTRVLATTPEEPETRWPRRPATWLLILAPLASATRYEALLLLGIIGLLLLLRRRFRLALSLAALTALPPGIYALLNLAHGWFILPNSVLVKTMYSYQASTLAAWLIKLLAPFGRGVLLVSIHPHLLSLGLVTLALVLWHYRAPWTTRNTMLRLFALSFVLHWLFSREGWFYRYEAYVMAMGVFALGLALGEYLSTLQAFRPKWRDIPLYLGVAMLFIYTVTPLVERGYESLKITSTAMKNIYEQHVQMSLFLEAYYPGEVIAVNDIGMISFISTAQPLDLMGLADMEVGRAQLSMQFSSEFVAGLVARRGAEIAIIYDNWFKPSGVLPDTWQLVGQWTLIDNVVTGGDTLSFYAITPAAAPALAENLRLFSPNLPADVIEQGKYQPTP